MGLEFSLGEKNIMALPILITGTWEPYETEILKSLLKEGEVFIDVGANFGYYSCLASSIVGPTGRVYAFEPDPKAYRLLKKNEEDNKLVNIVTINKALGDKVHIGTFYPNRLGHGYTVEPLVGTGKIAYGVEVAPLDEEIKGEVNIIKIDTDGYEVEVLRGMERIIKENKNLKIFIEVYPRGLKRRGHTVGDLIGILQDSFSLQVISEDKKTLLPIDGLYREAKRVGAANLLCIRK